MHRHEAIFKRLLARQLVRIKLRSVTKPTVILNAVKDLLLQGLDPPNTADPSLRSGWH